MISSKKYGADRPYGDSCCQRPSQRIYFDQHIGFMKLREPLRFTRYTVPQNQPSADSSNAEIREGLNNLANTLHQQVISLEVIIIALCLELGVEDAPYCPGR